MFTRITGLTSALVTAIVVLIGGAILRGGAASADPDQDEQFLALLDEEGIPALDGVPSLIVTAHHVCHILDAGMPVDDLVDAMVNHAYGIDPRERLYPPGRLARTEARFITAAVETYCPYDQSKIASIMANPAPGSNEPTHRVAAYTHNAVDSEGHRREPPPALDMINMPAAWRQPTGIGAARLPHLMDGGVLGLGRYGDDRSDCDAHGLVLASLIGAVPSGEVTEPSPPQIPAPPPPAAQIRIPHQPMATPPPPKQPPPPPQQVEPPAVGPQPGGAAGSGGDGSTGGGGNGSGSTGGNGRGGPAEPSPAPPMPPGFVRLAP